MPAAAFRLLLIVTSVLAVAPVLGQPAGGLGGALVESVLGGAERALEPDALGGLSAPDVARLRRYVERRNAFTSQLTEPVGPGAEGAFVHARRVSIERELVALVDRPSVEAEAAAAARAAAPTSPGGGDPATYAREVAWAEAWVGAHPDSSLAPYFYAYIAWQLRAGIELNDDRSLRERLARKYRTMLSRVRAQEDRIWVLLAADLDAMARVTNAAAAHPREFLPAG